MFSITKRNLGIALGIGVASIIMYVQGPTNTNQLEQTIKQTRQELSSPTLEELFSTNYNPKVTPIRIDSTYEVDSLPTTQYKQFINDSSSN